MRKNSRYIKICRFFPTVFSDDNFSEVYEAKSEINHDLMSYTDTILADNKDQLEEEYGSGSYVEVRAGESVWYLFSPTEWRRLQMQPLPKKTLTMVPGWRICGAERNSVRVPRFIVWSPGRTGLLVIPVNEDDYNRMKNLRKKDIHTVQVTFRADNFVTNASFECQKKEDSCYVMLKFDNYVQRYINQRYLSVRLQLSETSGLQIPAVRWFRRMSIKYRRNI